MRREDIKISTPGEPTLYAWGTKALNNPKIWEDPQVWNYGGYVPAYILDFKDGRVLALVAHYHPDSINPEFNRRAQATPEEAVGYSLADYQERLKKLEPFSRGTLTAEHRLKRERVFAKLKPKPINWEVTWATSANVKMLWSDYDQEMRSRLAEAENERQRERAARDARAVRADALLKKIEFFGNQVGYEPDDPNRMGSVRLSFSDYRQVIEVPLKLAELLIARAEEVGL